jgi:hypothetical protein
MDALDIHKKMNEAQIMSSEFSLKELLLTSSKVTFQTKKSCLCTYKRTLNLILHFHVYSVAYNNEIRYDSLANGTKIKMYPRHRPKLFVKFSQRSYGFAVNGSEIRYCRPNWCRHAH